MRIPQVGERRRVIGVGTHHVGGHLTVRHQRQLDVDDIVRELAAVQEACRTRVVVGQDIREQKLRDLRRLAGVVPK